MPARPSSAVLELAPDDADAAEALGRGAPAPPPRPAAAPRAPAPGRPPSAAARPPPVPPAPPAAAPARAAGPDAIPRLLTETDVYVKYGLHDKAIDHLAKVFAIDPDNPDAHEKMRDIHEAAGNKAAAVEAALTGGPRLRRPRPARIAPPERWIACVSLSPRHPELGLLAAAAGLPEPEAPAPAAEDDDLALAAGRAGGRGGRRRRGALGGAGVSPPPTSPGQDAELDRSLPDRGGCAAARRPAGRSRAARRAPAGAAARPRRARLREPPSPTSPTRWRRRTSTSSRGSWTRPARRFAPSSPRTPAIRR